MGKKWLKHFLWIALAMWTAHLLGYFSPITELGGTCCRPAGIREAFWVLFYGWRHLATPALREQVCKYMCPYARFQSAMFDRAP